MNGVQEVGGSNPLAPTDQETLDRESLFNPGVGFP